MIIKIIFCFNRIYDKQPMTGGIPVPVVKTSPWYQYPSSHAAYGDPKDWSIQDDMYSCHQKRGLISDNMSHLSKVTITWSLIYRYYFFPATYLLLLCNKLMCSFFYSKKEIADFNRCFDNYLLLFFFAPLTKYYIIVVVKCMYNG